MHLIAYAFNSYDAALAARTALQRYDAWRTAIKLGNMAIVGKLPNGTIKIDETRDLKYNSRLVGSTVVIGFAVGILLAALRVVQLPGRVLALGGGAAGLALGVLIMFIDTGLPDAALQQVGTGLAPGTTVLLLLVHPAEAAAVSSVLTRQGGRPIHDSFAPALQRTLLAPPSRLPGSR